VSEIVALLGQHTTPDEVITETVATYLAQSGALCDADRCTYGVLRCADEKLEDRLALGWLSLEADGFYAESSSSGVIDRRVEEGSVGLQGQLVTAAPPVGIGDLF
jgi:hypothetical protein